MKTKALLTLLWPMHYPVLQAYLSQRKRVVLTTAAYATSELKALVANAGSELTVLDRLPSEEMVETARATGRGQAAAIAALEGSGQWKLVSDAFGMSLAKAAARVFAAEGSLSGVLQDQVVVLEILARARERFDIELLAVSEDVMTLSRTAIAWARKHAIPSLHFAHAMPLGLPTTLHAKLSADFLAVYGERGASPYLDLGVAPERLRVTGNPAWDKYFDGRQRRQEIREKFCRDHRLDAQRPIVTYALSWDAGFSSALETRRWPDLLSAFCAACKASGIGDGQWIVKKHPHWEVVDEALINDVAVRNGLERDSWRLLSCDAFDCLLASDLTVSSHSNFAVESLVAGTPSINLLDEAALHLGNGFGPKEGIVEVTQERLGDAIHSVLCDAERRSGLVSEMEQSVTSFNVGVDGRAAERCAKAMEQIAGSEGESRPRYVWEELLNVADTETNQYHNWPRTQLFELFAHAPRRVLDIGCGAGATGQALKQTYPGVKVFGVEINHAAAELARTRIDHVLEGKFEEVDLESAGIAPGSLDTVLVADVLEHIYDPWNVLVRIKKYLAPDGQVIASIPNTRNLVLMDELSKGNWRYEPWGLLDVTHIRFFTLREIHRFFHETGYRITQLRHNIDGRLVDTFNRYKNQPLFNLEFERMTLKKVTQDELAELCTIQFFVRAEPGVTADSDYQQAIAETNLPDYSLWQKGRVLAAREGDLWENYLASWAKRPRVHLALLVLPEHLGRVGASLQSISGQLYEGSLVTVVTAVAASSGWQDSERLHWVQSSSCLIETAGQVLAGSGCEWVGILAAGDQLEPHALLFMIEAAQRQSAWRLIYSDEDVISAAGERKMPSFKPDFNPDLLRACPYVGGLLLVRQDLFGELGGFNAQCVGMEEYDLMLRTMEIMPAEAVGHLPEVLLHRLEGGGHAAPTLGDLRTNGQKALEAHFSRLGVDAELSDGLLPLSWQVNYRHAAQASVSIVIVVRDHVSEMQRTVEALLSNTLQWPFELLILDAGSTEPQARGFLDGLQAMGDSRIRLFRLEQDASWTAYCNLMAGEAASEYLLFLDFDVVPIDVNWLPMLMAHAQRPEIGVVGPRILGADGMVQRSGYVLGVGGSAVSAFPGLRFDNPGYAGRALVEQNVSAIGRGAVLTRTSTFQQLGGWDESLAPDEAAVDYCLRLSELGLRVLWTPHVSLMSGGVAATVDWSGMPAEQSSAEILGLRWFDRLAADPAYNRNLSLERGETFAIECRNSLNWDPLPWKPLPRIMVHYADNLGCGQYRILGPMGALVAGGRAQGWSEINLFKPIEVAHLELDSIVFQRQTTDEQLAVLEQHRKFTRCLKVFELDDLLINLPGKSIHRHEMPKDIGERIRRAASLCDRFVVTTEPLKLSYRGCNDDIRIVPNYLERWRWGDLKPLRRQSAKPRVGWVGGISHSGDLEMIADVVRELSGEVDWVFMGMCPESLRKYVHEFHEGLPFGFYPAKMASLNLDLALAPLEINPFNEAKSNLRLLEYGVLGYPVICSDIFPYQGDLPVTRVRNRANDWIKAIREHIADLDATARMGDVLRDAVKARWMLEDHLDVWMKAWLP